MKTQYRYDQDPRYGWVEVDLEGQTTGMVVVNDNGIFHGFNYHDGKMVPTCICNAWERSECGCTNLEWDYWE